MHRLPSTIEGMRRLRVGRSVEGRIRRAGSTSALTGAIACLVVAGGGVAAAVTTVHGSRAARSSSAEALDVLPFPGTPDAAPGTDIDFPAVSRSQVQSVTAVGSRSGLHAGRLSAQPARQGTAFSPDRPFLPGERVSVTATLRWAAAGTASGAPGARQISFTFAVARRGSATRGDARDARPGRMHAASTSASRTHTFVTHPGFRAPIVTMGGTNPDAAAGDIFLDAHNSGQNAAYFLSPQGALRWYRPVPCQPSHMSI